MNLKLCNFIGISIEEFWNVANQFRGPMWKKDNDNNWYNKYWDILENQE